MLLALFVVLFAALVATSGADDWEYRPSAPLRRRWEFPVRQLLGLSDDRVTSTATLNLARMLWLVWIGLVAWVYVIEPMRRERTSAASIAELDDDELDDDATLSDASDRKSGGDDTERR